MANLLAVSTEQVCQESTPPSNWFTFSGVVYAVFVTSVRTNSVHVRPWARHKKLRAVSRAFFFFLHDFTYPYSRISVSGLCAKLLDLELRFCGRIYCVHGQSFSVRPILWWWWSPVALQPLHRTTVVIVVEQKKAKVSTVSIGG